MIHTVNTMDDILLLLLQYSVSIIVCNVAEVKCNVYGVMKSRVITITCGADCFLLHWCTELIEIKCLST